MGLKEKAIIFIGSEFFKFCAVGTICTAIDTSIFYIVRQFAPYQVAMTTGYCLSLIVNYMLNIRWTFKKKPSVANAVAIITAHLINLFIVRMGLMWIFVNIIGLDDKIAYLPTLAISIVINFLMIKFAVNKVK